MKSLPPTVLCFNQHTRGFVTRLALLALDVGQNPVLRATMKQVEAKVTLETGGSVLIAPATNMAPSNTSAYSPTTSTASAMTNCSQPEKKWVADCILVIYTGTGVLVGTTAIELMVALICCRLCFQLGKNRHTEKRARSRKKGTMRNRPLPDPPLECTRNPTYNIHQDPNIPTGVNNPLIAEEGADIDDDDDDNNSHGDVDDDINDSGKDDSNEMMDNPMYNHHQKVNDPWYTWHHENGEPRQTSQEHSDLEYSYTQEGIRLLQELGHKHDSRVEIPDTQHLIAVDEDLSEENEVQPNTRAGKTSSLATEQERLETAKYQQDSGQDLPAKPAYQNVGSCKRTVQLGMKYQNVGQSNKNRPQESREERTTKDHQKKPLYLNTGSGWKQPVQCEEGGTADKNDKSAGKKLVKNAEYKNVGPRHHQTQQEEDTTFYSTGPQRPESQQADQNVTSQSKELHRGINSHKQTSLLQVDNGNIGRDSNSSQPWPLAMGTIQSDEPSLSGYQATYDLLTHYLGNSDDQQSDDSASDY